MTPMAEPNHLAFDDAYRRIFPLILNKCRRMIHDAAESQDLAQEVFVRLWRSRELIADPRALTAWLYRTCTRLAIDRARSRGRQDVALAAIAARGDGEGTASPEQQSASRRALAQVATQTPVRELEVAVLSRVDGLGHAEIADVVGASERTIRRLLVRFDERLRALRDAAGGVS
jgi:RNA polymerase sigma-70 factor (ECF subfamily)